MVVMMVVVVVGDGIAVMVEEAISLCRKRREN